MQGRLFLSVRVLQQPKMGSFLSEWEFLMRRIITLLLVAVLLTILVPLIEWDNSISLAQENGITVNRDQLDSSNIPRAKIDGVAPETIVLNSVTGPLALAADDPADSCQDAPEIFLYPDSPV